MGKKEIGSALRLFIITIIAGFALGCVYFVTKEPIAAQEVSKQQAAYKAVLAEAEEFKPLEDDAYSDEKIVETGAKVLAESGADYSNDDIEGVVIGYSGGQAVGAVITVTAHDGYSGDIKFSVGIDNEGTVQGVSLLSISETAGLGMRAKTDPSFLGQYVGNKVEEFTVVKDGTGASSEDKIDSIGGSTITSKAITNGINAALVMYRHLQDNALIAYLETGVIFK